MTFLFLVTQDVHKVRMCLNVTLFAQFRVDLLERLDNCIKLNKEYQRQFQKTKEKLRQNPKERQFEFRWDLIIVKHLLTKQIFWVLCKYDLHLNYSIEWHKIIFFPSTSFYQLFISNLTLVIHQNILSHKNIGLPLSLGHGLNLILSPLQWKLHFWKVWHFLQTPREDCRHD